MAARAHFSREQEGAVNLGLGTSGRIRAKKSEVSGNRDVTSMLSREVQTPVNKWFPQQCFERL